MNHASIPGGAEVIIFIIFLVIFPSFSEERCLIYVFVEFFIEMKNNERQTWLKRLFFREFNEQITLPSPP